MYKVIINGEIILADYGEVLADILFKSAKPLPHICGGKGICKKCWVLVNGKNELSCQYKITSDIEVVLPAKTEIYSEIGTEETGALTQNTCFCLDIGTTTLALALVSLDEKKIIKVKTATNPQTIFGADVLSRIDYCNKNGVSPLQNCLIDTLNAMIDSFGVETQKIIYVSGNTTMLHLFFGADCSSMGVAPYTPVFLESQKIKAEEIGLKNIENIVSLPCVSAYVGADLVAGVNYADFPKENKFNLLVDLGTNAEIVLYNKEKLYCTSAAAGPCFEGANISCGMGATNGAIYTYEFNGDYKTINNTEAKGICGTGLIDIVSALLHNDLIDDTGYMDNEEISITHNIKITQADIRQFQLAKSAIYTGITALLNEKSISFEDIDNAFISGGFSAKINIENATRLGLLPKDLKYKIKQINNSSLLGTVKYACEHNDLSSCTNNAEYIDLSTNDFFSIIFINNLDFYI